jgi:hypothetical protein
MRLAWFFVIFGFAVSVVLIYGRLFVKEMRDVPVTTILVIGTAIMLLAVPLKPRR